jgi:hypothetical protein
MKRLASLFSQLDNIAQQFSDEDTSFERSLQFKRGLDNILTPYKEMYAQKQKLVRQTSMMQYLRPRSASPVPTASEPGPSTSTPLPGSERGSPSTISLSYL